MATSSNPLKEEFAELICQSNFSFLEGASHPEEMVRQACFYQYKAIAITDECSMAGVVRAYTEIKNNHLPIKLIVGSKFKFENQTFVLLCSTKKAYSECCRIITNARRRASKGKYELSEWDLLSIQHCFCIWLPSGQKEADRKWATWLTKHYTGRAWLGIKRWLTANEYDHIHYCETLARDYGFDIVATTCSLMHDPSRQALQHTLHAIKSGKLISELGREGISNKESCLKPLSKLAQLYPKEWLANTVRIANLCEFHLSEISYQYPAELVPKTHTATSYLRVLVERGIKKRFTSGITEKTRQIIEKELMLIHEQAYEYFFLTIYDIVQFAQSQHILYQGRGSAANSIVCYCLEITAVDPEQIDVLFERFISKERNEPPDIDVDFEHERREEIIQYIYTKYGRERTAIAATVVCYRFKSALRDVGKALGINNTDLDYFIQNMNGRDRAMSWQSQLSELGIATDSTLGKNFTHLVEQIMGFPRHLSQHVGGFVISAGPLYDLVPIENAAMADRTLIQWDKDDLESLALLKVDVLALGMLSAIGKMFNLVGHHYGQHFSIADITKLPDDSDVFKQIQAADTVGVFQIESRAQMTMLPRLKPRCYYDLVVQIAIVRPGPIQGGMVHPYLRRRDKLEAIEYPSPEVKEVLARTMGVPIFQEQVIKLAMVAAGFSGGEADQLRRAMTSWKKNGDLYRFKQKLVDGMLQRGYSEEYALRIFEQICGFGEYGFPESHSASFAVLAYVSAWIKYHYPIPFYVGLLNSLPMGFYSASQLIQDAKHHHITTAACCINVSDYDHKIEQQEADDVIRLGLRLVKGLRNDSAKKIVAQRPTTGYKNLQSLRLLNLPNSCLQALASANAFHCFTHNRYQARWELMDTMAVLPILANNNPNTPNSDDKDLLSQPSLFDDLIEDYASIGLSVDHHPIALLNNAGLLPKFTCASQLDNIPQNTIVSVIGVVSGKQSPGTAAGVTFITLEDHTGNTNVVVWQNTARAQKKVFLTAKILQVKGILERGDAGVTHVIAGRLIDQTCLLTELETKSRDFK